jgi:hypothetical protein
MTPRDAQSRIARNHHLTGCLRPERNRSVRSSFRFKYEIHVAPGPVGQYDHITGLCGS